MFAWCGETKTPQVVSKWGVVDSPRQCASAQSLECATNFNQKQHDSASPPAIFTRSRSVRLLFIPPNEKSPQRNPWSQQVSGCRPLTCWDHGLTFCGCGRGEEKNDGGIKRHHSERVSGLLWKVENTFRPAHCIKWTVLWRRLNL